MARTARYYTLGDPAGELRQVWFVCHGYRQLAARFLRHFAVLDDGSRLTVAPEALNRFYLDDAPGPHGPEARIGGTWMTREDRLSEISDYVSYMDAVYDRIFEQVDRSAVELHVLGFSQGAATVSRWAAYGRAEADHLILWAGFPPPDLELGAVRERLARPRLTLVLGTEDEFAAPEALAQQEVRLREQGLACRLVTFRGGHRLDPAVLHELAMSPAPA